MTGQERYRILYLIQDDELTAEEEKETVTPPRRTPAPGRLRVDPPRVMLALMRTRNHNAI